MVPHFDISTYISAYIFTCALKVPRTNRSMSMSSVLTFYHIWLQLKPSYVARYTYNILLIQCKILHLISYYLDIVSSPLRPFNIKVNIYVIPYLQLEFVVFCYCCYCICIYFASLKHFHFHTWHFYRQVLFIITFKEFS